MSGDDNLRDRWGRISDGEATHTVQADTDDLLPPTTFGPAYDTADERLEVGELLGKGGHSLVHLARQTSLDRPVAVKSARMDVSEPDSRRILHEARVMGALEHPNIIPVYDVDTDTGNPRIVLKRVEGTEWSKCLRKPPSADPLAWNVRILVQVCNAVEFAHSHGILHRDIKPQNVMLGSFGEVYLMDWGLAVSTRRRDRNRFPLAEHQNQPVGTPAYMAPEMVFGSGSDLCPETDVYLLGGTLYHVLAGRPPRDGEAHKALAEILMGKTVEIPDATPPVLADLCLQMLAESPEDRPTASAVRETLMVWLDTRGIERMVDRAHDQLRQFQSAIADEADPGQVQERFGACRSVFEAVLDAAPGRADATDGLRQAVLTMVRFALDHRDERTARFLLEGLDDPPASVLAEIEALESHNAAEVEELARLRREDDPVWGAGLRIALLVCAALVWGGVPAILSLTMERSYLRGIIMISLVSLFTVVLVGVASRFLWHTRMNRKLAGVILLGPLVSAPAFVGAWFAGLPPEFGGVFVMLVLSAMSAAGTFLEDPRLLPSTIVFFIGFWIVCVWPNALFGALVFCTLFMAANGVAGWGPAWLMRALEDLGRERS